MRRNQGAATTDNPSVCWTLPFCTLAFSAGVALAALAPSRAAVASIVALALALLAYGVSLRRWATPLGVAAAAPWLLLGALSWHQFSSTPDPSCDVARYATSRATQRLALEVLTEAQTTATGARQRARALWIRQAGAASRACGDVTVYHASETPGVRGRSGPQLRLAVGQRIVVRARVRPVSPLARAQFGIRARVFVKAESIVRLGHQRVGLLARVRARLAAVITRACGQSADTGAILRALVLGDRAAVGRRQREVYARAGLSHLLAVSGLHLSLVAGAVFGVLALLVRRWGWFAARWPADRLAALGAVGSAVAYTALTCGSPATVRACVMACSGFSARLISRPGDFIRPLALACLVLLALDPRNLFRPGFQLSFAAVVGIALAAVHPLARRLAGGGTFKRVTVGLLVASIGASAATAPLVAYHFGSVSVVGVLLNLLAVPWTAYLLLPLALSGALVGLVSIDWGAGLLWGADRLAAVLDAGASWAAALDFAALQLPLGLVGVLGGLLLVAVLLAGRRNWRLAAVGGAALLAGDLVSGLACGGPGDGAEVSFIDVGQGDSTLVRFADGATMLVDAGGSGWSGFDPGRTRVVPYLRSLGIRRLDYLVVSHPDADHAGGARAVLESVAVGELWLCWHSGHNDWIERLRSWAADHAVAVRQPRSVRHGSATVRPLWPPSRRASCADPSLSTNNNSIVLQIDVGAGSVLLSGDVEAEVESRLLEAGLLGRISLLKVPHHGSDTSSTARFLAAVRPRLAVVSCGLANRFGFPHVAVLQRYRRLAIPLGRLDQLGTIRVKLGLDGRLSSPALEKIDTRAPP